MKRYPVVFFYILAFAISWLGWLPQTAHARGLFPFDSFAFTILGGLGPTLAAVTMMLTLKGKDGPGKLLAPILQWRVGIIWYMVALLGQAAVSCAVLSVDTLIGGPPLAWGEFGSWHRVLPLFVVMVLTNTWEKVGWRGFALPRLQARYSALVSSIIIVLLWGLWHLPLMLNPDTATSGLPIPAQLVFCIALAIIYTWLYNNTKGSLLIVSLFHAASNTVAFALQPVDTAFVRHYLMTVGLIAMIAVVIVVTFGPTRLSRKPNAYHPTG